MKKIEAIIRESKFDAVKKILIKIGVKGITAYDVWGRGEQIGMSFSDSQNPLQGEQLTIKKKIEIVCIDEELDKILSSIMINAHTGKEGDGKIFVYDVDEVIKIRTKERVKIS